MLAHHPCWRIREKGRRVVLLLGGQWLTNGSMSFPADDQGAFDNGSPRVVNAVQHRL